MTAQELEYAQYLMDQLRDEEALEALKISQYDSMGLEFQERSNYDELGRPDGIKEIWWEGQLLQSQTYKSGVLHGPAYLLWSDEQNPETHLHFNYRNGIPYGKEVESHTDGRIIKKTYNLKLR